MNYTVCFLFTDNGEKVLLQKKDKTQYAGRLNGVGGKIEPGETPLEGARREIMEETGASIQDLIWLGTLIFPKDCGLPADQDNVDCELNFFAGTVEDTKMVSQQPGPGHHGEGFRSRNWQKAGSRCRQVVLEGCGQLNQGSKVP